MFKCDQCGGDLKYDIKSKVLKCDYCNQSISIQSYHQKFKSAKQEFSIFTCPYCGGEVVTNDSRIADFCSYCGSPTMLQRREEERRMPERIVPFSVTAKECENQYMKYIEKMPYVPMEYKAQKGNLDFRGIYVPFHSYDVDIEGTARYQGKKDTLEKKRKHRVDVYKIDATISGKSANIVHDASVMFSDVASEAIVCGDTIGESFEPAYLSGFYADMEDISWESYEEYAKEQAKSVVNSKIEEKINSQKGSNYLLIKKKQDLNYEVIRKSDVLRPVWFMTRKTGDRVAYAIVNGKTKDIVADIPVDTKKLVKISLISSAILFVLLQIFITLTPKAMVGFASCFNFVMALVYFSNVRKIYQREINDKADKGKKWKKAGKTIGIAVLSTICLFYFLLCLVDASIVGVCVVFLLLEIGLLLLHIGRWRKIEKHGTHVTKWIAGTYAMAGILTALSIWNPVHDGWYYAGGVASLIFAIIVILQTIKDYNLLCSMPLPQFAAYKGGFQNEEV